MARGKAEREVYGPQETEEHKQWRVKRQISRDAYMQYMRNINRPDYDPRAEEGKDDFISR